MSCEETEKTLRIGMYCTVIVILGLFIFLFKINGCNSSCQDAFHPYDNTLSYQTCSSGANLEIVTSPPAPRAGVICRCVKSTTSETK